MTQQRESIITDEMRAAIGNESDPVTYEVDNTGCRQFARSVGYTDPIFYDEAAAKARGLSRRRRPAGFLGHPVSSSQASPRHAGPKPSASRPTSSASSTAAPTIEYFDDVCAGDVLTGDA